MYFLIMYSTKSVNLNNYNDQNAKITKLVY